MTEDPDSHGESLEEIATFLTGVEAFKTLSPDQLSRVAASVTHRSVSAGEAMIVEGGLPGTQLFVLRDGTLDLLRRESLVTVMTSGELLGYPSLLTGTAPAFTVRARSDCALYCIPGDLGVELLSREDGVRWLATTQRDALLYAARSLSPLPEVQTLPVTSVVRGAPQLCDPEMTISEAAEIMIAQGHSAVLVRARQGPGIVTDVDLRKKVVAGRVSRDAQVSAIMSAPVHTIGTDALAAEASIAMLTHGVSHLPVLDEDGIVIGIVTAGDLMSLEARNPFALRHSMQWARDENELASAASDMPKLLVDLLDARLDAPLICRVLTVLHDCLTARLLELAFARHGPPPVDYAWLVFGSAARNEFTLASDQDNGLAYADTDDPAVDAYFGRVAEDVNAGLARCGIEADPHAVLAGTPYWHKTLTGWRSVFSRCLEGDDLKQVVHASVCFDYRQSVGQLYVTQELTGIMREAHTHPHFMQWLARLGSDMHPPVLGFRQKLGRVLDIKQGGLVPVQNLARYHALARGITIQATLERLAAICKVDDEGAECDRTLREAYLTLKQLQLEHHADAVREGRKPDNVIDTDALRPLTRANLQEALRVVTAAQSRFPRLSAGWRSL
jgi:CBS domain-containing protein